LIQNNESATPWKKEGRDVTIIWLINKVAMMASLKKTLVVNGTPSVRQVRSGRLTFHSHHQLQGSRVNAGFWRVFN
jgi:hypothetical protein